MSYRIHQGKRSISAITNSGLILTFTEAELKQIATARIPSYIDACVRMAVADEKLSQLGAR